MKTLLNYGDGPSAIYEELKGRIISGNLKAGDELRIMPLAKDLDVSIVPLREAIRMLAADDLIELRPRRSPIIARLDRLQLIEMNQIRRALEPLVLADAVDKHSDATIAECEVLLEKDRASSDLWEKVELNKQFHMALLAPSHWKRSIAIISGQYDGIARATQYLVVDHGGMVGQYHDEHDAILKAVRAGAVEQSVELMCRHIDQSTERARKELDHLDPSENAAIPQQ